MSGPFGSSQWMYASGGFYPYQIEQSLRFNDDDSAYLSRTPASAGNRKTWTWSGWVKRGNLVPGYLFTTYGSADDATFFRIAFGIFGGNELAVTAFNVATFNLRTTAEFRDPSAWYHIVFALDTTQATASDRAKLYVNGVQQTAFTTANYPALNADFGINQTAEHNIGRIPVTTPVHFDGYMAEVNFIDGTALTPTSFGETKSGIWVPKAYAGSYGTNGFYLSFADSAAIGDDLSGNGNDWTANNLVATDVLLDSPTNNYAVLNNLAFSGSAGLLADGNLAYRDATGAASWKSRWSTIALPTTGKWYAEFTLSYSGSAGFTFQAGVGLHDGLSATSYTGASAGSYGYLATGDKYNNAAASAYGATYGNGDVIGVAWDADAGNLTFYKNGVSQGVAYSGVSAENKFFGISTFWVTPDGTTWWYPNFGQSAFAYTPPTGFLALNTANLPDPVIDPAQDDVPSDYFDSVIWTGDTTTKQIPLGFTADFVWAKRRNGADGHVLYDFIRGENVQLTSNSTAGDTTNDYGLDFLGHDYLEVDGTKYFGGGGGGSPTFVAWNWLAGNGTASNTDGSITSTVSVNQKAGFSVVTGTAPASTGAFTTGHGLGVSPAMIITKTRSGTAYNWWTWHKALSNAAQSYIGLNLTNAAATDVSLWANTAPTSTVWSMTSGNYPSNSQNFVAYCFAEVEGYSKFGRYTGNGSTDGPFVWCGFRPAWVMVKRTDAAANWGITDNNRSPYNVGDQWLFANLSDAEYAGTLGANIDLLSNGFKLRIAGGTGFNTSGGTYIFAAFAENPFKYANAR